MAQFREILRVLAKIVVGPITNRRGGPLPLPSLALFPSFQQAWSLGYSCTGYSALAFQGAKSATGLKYGKRKLYLESISSRGEVKVLGIPIRSNADGTSPSEVLSGSGIQQTVTGFQEGPLGAFQKVPCPHFFGKATPSKQCLSLSEERERICLCSNRPAVLAHSFLELCCVILSLVEAALQMKIIPGPSDSCFLTVLLGGSVKCF